MDYHRQTLDNVAEASRRTRKLCAVMLDTLGREIVVRRNATIGPDGWPVHEETMKVVSGQKVGLQDSALLHAAGSWGLWTLPEGPGTTAPRCMSRRLHECLQSVRAQHCVGAEMLTGTKQNALPVHLHVAAMLLRTGGPTRSWC